MMLLSLLIVYCLLLIAVARNNKQKTINILRQESF